MLLYTNLSFYRCGEIFIDSVMKAEMTNRLIHKSFVINMKSNSYRMKEIKALLGDFNLE
ncbi:ATP-binding protein [Clostridium ihumii]|uniref:ATP-binding protein n=1 Tax=Clostridium ihumii TaxID=1470356 RepID=UPI002418B0DD|nr:ATP-binding protein [Clostridium ihumii]